MAYQATRADSLRMEVSAVEVVHLTAVGTLPGVAVLAVAGRNGPGTGRLRSQGADGTLLSWRAPGSAVWGPDVDASLDGIYLLEDGADAGKWARVQTYGAHMTPAADEAEVLLVDRYNNEIGSDDLTAAEASAGDVETYTVDLANDNPVGLSNLRVWLDAAVVDLEISDDGAAWVSPTSEAAALVLPPLAGGANDVLHFRRTIGAASPADPAVLNDVRLAFNAI